LARLKRRGKYGTVEKSKIFQKNPHGKFSFEKSRAGKEVFKKPDGVKMVYIDRI
jgi:hypothetical protein